MKNIGPAAIRAQKALVWYTEPEIKVLISSDGRTFDNYECGAFAVFGIPDTQRQTRLFKPNESWYYDLTVHYTLRRPSGLALEQAGIYLVRVVYPLLWFRPGNQYSQRTEFRSSVVSVHVRAPTGVDKEVWVSINDAEFARFVHSGFTRNPQTVAKAIAALQRFTTSTYHPHIRRALEDYYDLKNSRLDPDERRQLESLGIGRGDIGEQLFPDDRRLDREVAFASPEYVPLERALIDLTRQSGVLLKLHPDLSNRRVKSLRAQPLRQLMATLSVYRSSWRRDAEGYVLVPAK